MRRWDVNFRNSYSAPQIKFLKRLSTLATLTMQTSFVSLRLLPFLTIASLVDSRSRRERETEQNKGRSPRTTLSLLLSDGAGSGARHRRVQARAADTSTR